MDGIATDVAMEVVEIVACRIGPLNAHEAGNAVPFLLVRLPGLPWPLAARVRVSDGRTAHTSRHRAWPVPAGDRRCYARFA